MLNSGIPWLQEGWVSNMRFLVGIGEIVVHNAPECEFCGGDQNRTNAFLLPLLAIVGRPTFDWYCIQNYICLILAFYIARYADFVSVIM